MKMNDIEKIIKWSELREIIPDRKPIITDTEFGCYENIDKYNVPGKFDDSQVMKLSSFGNSLYVKLIKPDSSEKIKL